MDRFTAWQLRTIGKICLRICKSPERRHIAQLYIDWADGKITDDEFVNG